MTTPLLGKILLDNGYITADNLKMLGTS